MAEWLHREESGARRSDAVRRSAMGRSVLTRVGACAAIGAIATAASAGTTTWIDPSGGAWTDPTKWSNGVPTASDIAVLPGFAGDAGYAITLAGAHSVATIQAGGQLAMIELVGSGSLVAANGCYVGIAGPGTLRVAGPAVTVHGPVVVGSTFGASALRVEGGSVMTSTTLVASGNPGNAATIRLAGEGTIYFAGGGITAGVLGPGQLDVTEGAALSGSSLTLGAQAGTIITLTEGATAPIQLFGPLKRGGVLAVTLDPSFEPIANLQLPLIASPVPMTSVWQTTLLPLVYGASAMVVPTALGEYLQIPDPAIELVIEPNPIEVVVGSAVEFDVYKRRLSGLLELVCCDGDGDGDLAFYQSPPGGTIFEIDSVPPHAVLGLAQGQGTLFAKIFQPGADLVGQATVSVDEPPLLATQRVTLTASGDQLSLDTPSLSPQLSMNTLRLSADGRFALFASCAPELLPAGSDIGPCQLYLKDLDTGSVEIVSIGPNARFAGSPQAAAQFLGADLSADARFIVFSTTATNWTDPPVPAAGEGQIWMRDRLLGVTEIITANTAWSPPVMWNGQSTLPRITPDGAFVVFETAATNIFPLGLNGTKRDIVRWSRLDNAFAVASALEGYPVLNEGSSHPTISADGRFIAFATAAPNAFPPGYDPFPLRQRVFRRDMTMLALEVVSVHADGTIANDRCERPSIDASGMVVAFDSVATNLGAGASAAGRVWVRDLVAQSTEIIDVSGGPEGLSGTASAPVLSANGRFVALSALPTSNPSVPLVNAAAFRFDRVSGAAERIARSFNGAPLVGCYAGVAMSDNGRSLLFATAENSVVPFDTNAAVDIFVTRLAGLPGDLNGDASVGPEDLAILLGAWGPALGSVAADLDGDGVVGPADLARLLGAWTP